MDRVFKDNPKFIKKDNIDSLYMLSENLGALVVNNNNERKTCNFVVWGWRLWSCCFCLCVLLGVFSREDDQI